MDLHLQGKRALVLGSSSGLGRAVAASLVAEGARVVVTSRSPERASSSADALGNATVGVAVDLTAAGAGAEVVADAVAALGGLDICVVNTGGGRPGGILDTGGADEAAYTSMLRPALELSRAAAPHLRSSPSGRLVFLTARSVVEASPDLALSSVFRSGVHALARSLALELAPEVNVTVVVTGQFDTPALARFEQARASAEGVPVEQVSAEHLAQIPLGRVGRPEELAAPVTFLCSPLASFISGTTLQITGGAVRGF